jgi:hypothetical protein
MAQTLYTVTTLANELGFANTHAQTMLKKAGIEPVSTTGANGRMKLYDERAREYLVQQRKRIDEKWRAVQAKKDAAAARKRGKVQVVSLNHMESGIAKLLKSMADIEAALEHLWVQNDEIVKQLRQLADKLDARNSASDLQFPPLNVSPETITTFEAALTQVD